MKKKLLLALLMLLSLCSAAFGTLTYDSADYLRDRAYALSGHQYLDPIYLNMNEVEGILEASTSIPALYFTPSASATASEGMVYYDSDTDTLNYRNASAWVELAAGAGDNTLDNAYDQGGSGAGRSIDVDTGAVTLTVSDTDDNVALAVVQNDATNDPDAMTITMGAGSTGTALTIDSQATGTDIAGDNWNVSQVGTATLTGLTSTGVAVNLNASSNFATNINTGTSTGALSLGGGSGTVAVNSTHWDVSTAGAFSGVASVAMVPSASSISLTSNGAADDFTVSLAGATDSSLILSSTGTGADALKISTSAGGMDLTVAGAAGGEDLDIAANSSVNISSSEDVADSIKLESTAGGVDILASGAAAGEDIDITATGSSVNVTSTEADAAAVTIDASDAAGGITVDFGTGNMVVTGTGASADFTLDADLISIDGTGTSNISFANAEGEDVTIATTGAADHSLIVTASGTAGDALQISASAGGVDFSSATTMDIDSTGVFTLNQAGDTITIQLDSDGAGDDLSLIVDGDDDASIVLNCDGTAANAIDIDTSAGGIDIDMAGGAADEDFQITTATSIDFISTEAAAGQFKMDAQGTVEGYAIILETTEGGIHLLCDGDTEGDITIDAEDDLTLIAGDTLTLTNTTKIIIDGMATQLIEIEGTANDHETTISVTDPTADNTISLPDDTGSVAYTPTGKTTKDASDAAIPITHAIVEGTSGAASAWSLANGENGQILTIAIVTDGGEATITPATSTGWATGVLTDDGDTLSLLYVDDTVGWVVLGSAGIAGMPNITQ